jgi:two-component system, NtrC family, sensor kinase
VLLFARAEKTEKSPHNLNDVIRHAVDVTRSYSESGKLVVNFQPDETLPPMRLNPTELEQVIVNLLVNAYEASGGSVTIDIRTQRVDGMIRCSVSDNGPGISHDMMKHIFDPFFSTKRQRGNTGLGLSLSHGIVTDHGGRMSVQSAVGVGTTFILEFPESKEGEELSVGNT